MELRGNTLIAVIAAFEALQLVAFWAFLHHRYRRALKQLGKLTGQIATGERPKSYYVDGPPAVEHISRNVEVIGTRLEQFQRQQKEEDFNLNVLLANMVEGVVVVDQKHVVRLVNKELLALFDLKETPVGRTLLEAMREARVKMIVREAIQRGEPQQEEVVLESMTPALPSRHFDISVMPIRNPENDVQGAVAVFHDITRIKQLEVMRQEFVSNVSHELRTPLAIFRGYLETLADSPNLPREEAQRIYETLQRHSDRLHALVEDLLVLTRLEARQVRTEFSTIRADAFFRQLARDWEMRTKSSDAELILKLDPDLPTFDGDALRLEQVMFNLLENAVAYSNPPKRVVISAALAGGEIEIRVADNGIGIPPGDLPNIFERFYRVDKARSRSSGGTGLGLAIVKSIVQTHSGTVEAQSDFGKGTTVVIRLPLRQQ